jgi:hypothetical protein
MGEGAMTDVFKKLNYKDQDPILVLSPPSAFEEALKPLSLQPVRQVAIDDDWSALRFKPGS